jgi:DNA-binding transcriptional ArsR family regulator
MERQTTLISEVMTDMNPDVLTFIQQHITSFVRWDAMRFLDENPSTQDTASNLARYIGRDRQMVSRETAALAKEGILKAEKRGSRIVYSLTADAEIRRLIGDVVAAARERAFRMKLVYHILRQGDQP